MATTLGSLRSRALLTALLVVPCIGAAIVAGCSDDDTVASAPTNDAGSTLPPSSNSDSGNIVDPPANPNDGGVDAAAQVARGEYLVDHVAACGDCHTPRNPDGTPDMANYLAGADCFVDLNGPADGGCALSTANLTNHGTGLLNRTADQIKKMFQNGERPDGKFLAPVMPYYVFHNMTTEDADAVVAYLRTVPGVDHTVQAATAPFVDLPAAATPIDPSTIPATDAGAGAEHGRYLATMAGVCIECHTPELAQPAARPIDMTKPFSGDHAFDIGGPFPPKVYAANITPDPTTGLNNWTVQDIVKVIKQALDRSDGGVCPPMPVGPMGAFGGLTDQDALDIATYIHSLPPINHAVTLGNGSCVSPF